MSPLPLVAIGLSCAFAASAIAQPAVVFRALDGDGHVTYSDSPSPGAISLVLPESEGIVVTDPSRAHATASARNAFATLPLASSRPELERILGQARLELALARAALDAALRNPEAFDGGGGVSPIGGRGDVVPSAIGGTAGAYPSPVGGAGGVYTSAAGGVGSAFTPSANGGGSGECNSVSPMGGVAARTASRRPAGSTGGCRAAGRHDDNIAQLQAEIVTKSAEIDRLEHLLAREQH